MKEKHCSIEVKELRSDEYFQERGHSPLKYSVLAKSVYQLNYDLIDSFQGDTFLEVGCGSDSVFARKFERKWFGIDVVNPTKGTFPYNFKLGSVGSIPFSNNKFDLVVSNQSIEHWFEYDVSIERGLSEINRVLKDGGIFVVNFPIHLHGHRIFVLNKQSQLEKKIYNSGFSIIRKVRVEHNSNYHGWRLCGFYDSYVENKSEQFLGASYVMELTLKKEKSINSPSETSSNSSTRMTRLQRRLHHGLGVVIYSFYRRIINKK